MKVIAFPKKDAWSNDVLPSVCHLLNDDNMTLCGRGNSNMRRFVVIEKEWDQLNTPGSTFSGPRQCRDCLRVESGS